MKIVQLLPELNEGGVERGVVELNREFVKLGHESIVISAGGKQAGQIDTDGGRHIVQDVASKNLLTAPLRVHRLRALLRELEPDIVHARSRVPAWLAYLAHKKLHVPFVTTVHGFNSVNKYSQVMTFGDKVICVSNSIKDYVIKHYAVPEEKLVVIPRGVDLEQFNPDRVDKAFMEGFRERFSLDGKFVVTTVGRITQLKDYETFIAAMALLKKEIPNLTALIVGGVRADKKGCFARLQQQVKELGAEGYLHFTGSQSKVAEIYALSDVVVSSSKKPESFGRSAAEALAMNVPVVGTAHGGMLDIVLPGRTGQLFSPGDVEGLMQAMLDCRGLQCQSLREFVVKYFTLEKMVEKTLDVYQKVIDD